MLFSNRGSYKGQQLLNKEKLKEVFGETDWKGYSTDNDFRGMNYQHSFWSKKINTKKCKTNATYMLGFGENDIIFLPSGVIIFRFLDEYDVRIDRLIKRLENLRSSCHKK